MDTIIVISIAGVLILVSVASLWERCGGCRKQYSQENNSKSWRLRLRLKKKKYKVSHMEDGRRMPHGVVTKNDAKYKPNLPTNAQKTPSVYPVYHIKEEIKVAAEVMQHPVQSVRGLNNLGNTCYFNSTMQALVHTNSVFREELEKLRINEPFVEEVLDFFSSMLPDNSRPPYSPDKLHRLFGQKSPRFADQRQHDSHECLRNFLDNIRKEERENSGAVDKRRVLTVVDSVFGGHFITVYTCKDCGTPYHVFEALLDISLPIMIDADDLAAMNSERISSQQKSAKGKPQTGSRKRDHQASQSDKAKKDKPIISPMEPDCKFAAKKDGTVKRKRDNSSVGTLQHKTTDKSTSKTKNSIAERHSTIIIVQPTTTEKDDDAEDKTVVGNNAEVQYDKQNVSQCYVTVEEIKDNTEQDKSGKQALHKNDEVPEEVENDLVKEADCDRYREALDTFMTPLSLSSPYMYLPNDETAKRKHVTVYDCLSYFTRNEHIADEYLCNDCYARYPPKEGEDPLLTSATKQTLILNPPAILTLHLKRFELKKGGSVKRNDIITYKELLNIAPYCSSMCLGIDPPCKNIWYSLYSVVVHHGSTLKSGHYTAYVKIRDCDSGFRKFLQNNFFDRDLTRERLIDMMQENHSDMAHTPTYKQPSGTWYCMDDSSCRKVSVTTVLNQEAYLLFYERIF